MRAYRKLRQRRNEQLCELYKLMRHRDESGSSIFYFDSDSADCEGLEEFLSRFDLVIKCVIIYCICRSQLMGVMPL